MRIDTQRKRLLFQAGFFTLFLLAPVFDLFRLDLNLKHFFFLGMHWTLGLDDFVAGEIDSTQAAINIVFRGVVPILGTIALGVWVSWKYGRLYCGWLCPHFSVVETINQLMRRTIGRQSLWDRHALPEENADGTVTKANPLNWLLLLPLVVAFAFVWAIALLTYLLPPDEIYGNLWNGTLTRNQSVFLGVGTLAFFVEFMFARHLFCRYACAVGLFQSIAWMGNRKAMVIGFNRRRVEECVDCNAACDNICPMRIKPRQIKRLMFTCTQCGQCADACTQVQANNPEGSLLKWVENECALDKSAREFGHHNDIPMHCHEQGKKK
ncbi:4Fe-4S binding protein [Sideroxydans lithotrophicus]|uniref:Iron-sulfur cluster-binding protein n=1 Tax=Sideroxydans lithotrophicus (strain ES-1) TaxID=580332 RepID=D5CQX8_SIDLE|nr:4Fe-4S binding protein [Sideroxydans lithotrophicus]ADE11364.1 iron-sulfur cluster-binding protein [Sideroxydans lithotrophicus ES-1]